MIYGPCRFGSYSRLESQVLRIAGADFQTLAIGGLLQTLAISKRSDFSN